jgi:hypothetical protein
MVRGDGQDKGPSVSKVQDDSDQDSGDVTDEESDSSYASAEDSLEIRIEVDRSWSTSGSKSSEVHASDYDTEEEDEPSSSSSRTGSLLKSRRVQSYHNFEHAHHVSSLMRTQQHSSSLRSHSGALNSRRVRISTLSSTPVPSPSIRSSTSHPDISSLCRQWESTGPANVTLTYKPGGTTISTSSSKSKGRKRSPSFHHT